MISNNSYNKAGFIVTLLITASALVTCGVTANKNNSTDGSFSSIRLKEVLQSVNLETMEVVDFGRRFDISYYDDLIVYHIADTMYAIREGARQNSLPVVLTSPYFVLKKGESTGYLYDFLHSTDHKRIPVDSMLNKMFAVMNGVLLSDSLFFLVDSGTDQAGGLLERYVLKVKKDASYPDSLYLYFKKDMLDIEFSMSPRLEQSKGMKLMKGQVVFLPSIDSFSKKKIPQREISFQIEKQILPNMDSVVKFLEAVKRNLY